MAIGTCSVPVRQSKISRADRLKITGVGKKKKRHAHRTETVPSESSLRIGHDGNTGKRFELAGIGALLILGVFFLATSWRKWPDPLIDFGRELYVPWRLSQGAVLYHDVAEQYGPLSQYLNSILFRCFGPGLMVLVWANLIIFVGIVATLYSLCRRAWGAFSAFVACAIFIAVFGFSQFGPTGNYNYATPYAHETTHGFFVCLLLTFALIAWITNPSIGRGFVAGLLFGLTAVLKPEFMLAGGVITIVAVVSGWRTIKRSLPRAIIAWMVAALLPTFAFAIFFATSLPWNAALADACHAWLSWVTRSPIASLSHNLVQMRFTGFDQPHSQFIQHAGATLLALSMVTAIAVSTRFINWSNRFWLPVILLAVVWGGTLAVSIFAIEWRGVGRCVLGLIGLYTLLRAVMTWRNDSQERSRSILRLLLATLACLLMARMALNGRLYQYGFVQAALASILIPAILIAEVPEWLRLARRGRVIVVVAILALIVPGVIILAAESKNTLRQKIVPIGEGVDRFYALPLQVDATGELVRNASVALQKAELGQTLLVLPEGIMINYLSRMRSPVADMFIPDPNQGFRANLEQNLPDWIVLISRDLREYGVERYGDATLMSWLNQHYTTAAHFGQSPLDYRERGAVILRRKLN
jgi:hypothetical protein